MESQDSVHLLLTAPGQDPFRLPESRWSMWVLTSEGALPPEAVAGMARPSAVSPRGERAVVAAVAANDLDALARIAAQSGPASDVARLLMVGWLATENPGSAIEMLGPLWASDLAWSNNKVLRRIWTTLHLHVELAPGVPALVPVGSTGLGLKQAELLAAAGRTAESISVLECLPSEPASLLALAAALLANGESRRVLELSAQVQNVDDASALILVACSVAARVEGDLDFAFDTITAALSVPFRHPAVIAGALEERAHLSSLARDDMAVRADLEALAALSGGAARVEVPTLVRRRRTEEDEKAILDRARTRMRRRITATGDPGTFGGRHHSTYRDEIVDMFALGQATAAEELLLGLLDSVEDEVAELGADLDPSFFLTLADLYQDSGRTEDLRALRERFSAAEARAQSLHGEEKEERGKTLYPATPTVTDAGLDVAYLGETLPVDDAELEAVLASALPDTRWPDDSNDRHERDDLEDEDEDESGDGSEPPQPPERELTPVERAIRGPRLRTL